MPDEDDRIYGAIEGVGFHKAMDPEAVAELQDMQRMYERIADSIRERKNIPFSRVLRQAQAKAEEAGAAAAEAESAEPADESHADTDTTG
jgi:hypothetical protein